MTRRDRKLLQRVMCWDWEINDRTIAGRRHLVDRLTRICKDERRRGLASCWTYHLALHRSLLSILEREKAALAALEAATPIAVE